MQTQEIKDIQGNTMFTVSIPIDIPLDLPVRMRHAVLHLLNDGESLKCADLSYADLGALNLGNIELEGANLKHASLEGSNLEGANLSHCNLQYANFNRANLDNANLYDAQFAGAKGDGARLRSHSILPFNVTTTLESIAFALGDGDSLACQLSIDVWNRFDVEDFERGILDWAMGDPSIDCSCIEGWFKSHQDEINGHLAVQRNEYANRNNVLDAIVSM